MQRKSIKAVALHATLRPRRRDCVWRGALRTLPVVQSFRAISVLVALVGGALFGMLISFMTSVFVCRDHRDALFLCNVWCFLSFWSLF